MKLWLKRIEKLTEKCFLSQGLSLMSILITGGAGFIGGHTAKLYALSGHAVVVLDNRASSELAVARYCKLFKGDISNTSLVRSILQDHNVTAVLHLAASAHVGDSMLQPSSYFANNVCGSLRLLDAMVSENVKQIVFASSSSVYGDASFVSDHEDEPTVPVSPYGESKLQIEHALPWYEHAYGLRWVALRYFNVAGAEEDLGEDISLSRRIIPRTVHSALRSGPPLRVFGTSFPTLDGSAVRDYVHVRDVARANMEALRFVREGNSGNIINIGSGVGTSVLQIIEAVREQAGVPVPYIVEAAHEGDPASAVSDITKARRLLGWNPVESRLSDIVSSVILSCQTRVEPGTYLAPP
jgi:UDP-glucose-4-epimerase GalE